MRSTAGPGVPPKRGDGATSREVPARSPNIRNIQRKGVLKDDLEESLILFFVTVTVTNITLLIARMCFFEGWKPV